MQSDPAACHLQSMSPLGYSEPPLTMFHSPLPITASLSSPSFLISPSPHYIVLGLSLFVLPCGCICPSCVYPRFITLLTIIHCHTIIYTLSWSSIVSPH